MRVHAGILPDDPPVVVQAKTVAADLQALRRACADVTRQITREAAVARGCKEKRRHA